MSMIASDIATIPASGFEWYALFLEDAFDDPVKTELSNNFLALGREVGRNVLVIRGFDPKEFYNSAYETLTLYDEQWQKRMQHLTAPHERVIGLPELIRKVVVLRWR